MIKVSAEQVEQGFDPQELISHLNDTQRGGFMYIHGYVASSSGEVANHWVQGACLYPNMIKKSLSIIDSGELFSKVQETGLKVSRGVWLDSKGKENPTGRKSKVFSEFRHITKVYSLSNASDHAKIMLELDNLRINLATPKKVDQGYKVEAKGAYSREGEPEGVLYFRDCMTVSRVVTKQGEFKQKGGKEDTAIKAALRKMLPIGRYRAYKLNNNFEYITVGGLSIVQGDVAQWELALCETEAIKNVEITKSAELVVEQVMVDAS